MAGILQQTPIPQIHPEQHVLDFVDRYSAPAASGQMGMMDSPNTDVPGMIAKIDTATGGVTVSTAVDVMGYTGQHDQYLSPADVPTDPTGHALLAYSMKQNAFVAATKEFNIDVATSSNERHSGAQLDESLSMVMAGRFLGAVNQGDCADERGVVGRGGRE